MRPRSKQGDTRWVPRPFLKWVGGKGQLLEELLPEVQLAGRFGRYYEPFLGGGALFFELCRLEIINGGRAWLSDSNGELVQTYEAVRDEVSSVGGLLLMHEREHNPLHFYEVRDCEETRRAAIAARMIYLNKTGFNGLYRVNSRGKFNVPIGQQTNPTICDGANLRACSLALRGARLMRADFESVLDTAAAGDLVYFDPPYDGVSKTANFSGHQPWGFSASDQTRLRDVAVKLTERKVKVIASNARTDLIADLYQSFNTREVKARRSVNSKADRRGPVAELLITNF